MYVCMIFTMKYMTLARHIVCQITIFELKYLLEFETDLHQTS